MLRHEPSRPESSHTLAGRDDNGAVAFTSGNGTEITEPERFRQCDLMGELSEAQAGLTPEWRDRLTSSGVSARALALGWVGIARCVTDGNHYQPHESGDDLVIVPVKAMDDQPTPEHSDPAGVLLCGDVCDLLAFRLDDPARWYSRGDAEWLGAVEPQLMSPDPVAIRRSPMTWLQHDGNGIVPLGRDAWSRYALLQTFRSLVAEDVAHARELRRWLELPARGPAILVTASSVRRAA